MTKPFWRPVNEPTLAQGDLLQECLVPVFAADFGTNGEDKIEDIPVGQADLGAAYAGRRCRVAL